MNARINYIKKFVGVKKIYTLKSNFIDLMSRFDNYRVTSELLCSDWTWDKLLTIRPAVIDINAATAADDVCSLIECVLQGGVNRSEEFTCKTLLPLFNTQMGLWIQSGNTMEYSARIFDYIMSSASNMNDPKFYVEVVSLILKDIRTQDRDSELQIKQQPSKPKDKKSQKLVVKVKPNNPQQQGLAVCLFVYMICYIYVFIFCLMIEYISLFYFGIK